MTPQKQNATRKEIERGEKAFKAAQLKPDLAKILAKEKEERELGDYDVMIDIDQERAAERVRQAEQFITSVKAFLSKGGL